MIVRDEGSVFDAPVERVWEFVASGDAHSRAHGHADWHRETGEGNSGTYSWTQPFDGRPTRFAMQWRSYHPLGVAYVVRDGPFAGSRFFLYYLPMGSRTGANVVGDFVSPSIPDERLSAAVLRFFAVEFEQDLAAIRALGPGTVPTPSRP